MSNMNEQELNEFKDKLASLVSSGTETDVRAYVNEQFPRLPESMQQEIVFNLFSSTITDEVRGQEAIAQVQEEGLAAAEVLKTAKEQLKKDGSA